MFARQKPAILTLALLLALAACSRDEGDATTGTKPGAGAATSGKYGPGSGGGGGGPGGVAGGGGGSSADGSDEEGGGAGGKGVSMTGGVGVAPARLDRDDHLQFLVIPRIYEVERGKPMLADFVLKNIGKESVRLVRPVRDLSENFTLRVKADNKVFTMRKRGWAPGDQAVGSRVETLEPGMSVQATVDLLPMLSATPGYVNGGLKFTVEYRGAAELAPAETGLWNPDGRVALVTQDILMEVLECQWLSRYEPDPETLRAHQAVAINAARAWSPTNPKHEKMVADLVGQGEVVVACLCQLVERMSLPDSESYGLAGKAFDMIRYLPKEALPILRRAHAEQPHPARSMLLSVLEEDERIQQGAPPSAGHAAVRDLGAGADTGSSLRIVVGDGSTRPIEYRVLPDGKLTVRRTENGRSYEFTVALATKQWIQLKTALIDGRAWCWRGVRESTLPDEGMVDIVLMPKSGAPVRTKMPEFEARTNNTLSAPVFRMLDSFTQDVQAPPSATVDTPKQVESPK